MGAVEGEHYHAALVVNLEQRATGLRGGVELG
jgi:hypothetical protein